MSCEPPTRPQTAGRWVNSRTHTRTPLLSRIQRCNTEDPVPISRYLSNHFPCPVLPTISESSPITKVSRQGILCSSYDQLIKCFIIYIDVTPLLPQIDKFTEIYSKLYFHNFNFIIQNYGPRQSPGAHIYIYIYVYIYIYICVGPGALPRSIILDYEIQMIKIKSLL